MAAEVPDALMAALNTADVKAAAVANSKDEFKLTKIGQIWFTFDNQVKNMEGVTMSLGEQLLPAYPSQGVLNLSDFFFGDKKDTLWSNKYGTAPNGAARGISERITAYVGDAKRWSALMGAKYYIPAADTTKPPKVLKRDVPNVNAAIVALLLTFKAEDVVFLNPKDMIQINKAAAAAQAAGQPAAAAGAGQPVWGWNMSAMARSIRRNLSKTTDIKFDAQNASCASFVFYCRGDGKADDATKALIDTAVQNDCVVVDQVAHRRARPVICNTQLTPGKYSATGVSSLCYDQFGESIGNIAMQLKCCQAYNAMSGQAIGRVYLSLDEFSGYSMALAAAAFGYGMEKETSLLAFNAGKMNPTPLAPWDHKTGKFYLWRAEDSKKKA